MTTRTHEVLTQQQYEEIWQLVSDARSTARRDSEAITLRRDDAERNRARDADDAALKALCRYLVRLTKFDDDETPAG